MHACKTQVSTFLSKISSCLCNQRHILRGIYFIVDLGCTKLTKVTITKTLLLQCKVIKCRHVKNLLLVLARERILYQPAFCLHLSCNHIHNIHLSCNILQKALCTRTSSLWPYIMASVLKQLGLGKAELASESKPALMSVGRDEDHFSIPSSPSLRLPPLSVNFPSISRSPISSSSLISNPFPPPFSIPGGPTPLV